MTQRFDKEIDRRGTDCLKREFIQQEEDPLRWEQTDRCFGEDRILPIGHWDVQVTSREGQTGRNSGVSIITIQRGKVVSVKDIIFDVGDEFRRSWDAA